MNLKYNSINKNMINKKKSTNNNIKKWKTFISKTKKISKIIQRLMNRK